MALDRIYSPIRPELREIDEGLKRLKRDIPFEFSKKVAAYFFNKPGKYLRPALFLFSAGASCGDLSALLRSDVVGSGCAIELIHSASLIHDDIIDGDSSRRDQPSMNVIMGDKVAVLGGDMLYSHAFYLLAKIFGNDSIRRMVSVTRDMCASEIDFCKSEDARISKERYLGLIRGKTAAFMSVCCYLGGEIARADEATRNLLADFGLGFGMAYQLLDDLTDGQDAPDGVSFIELAYAHIQDALIKLDGLPNNVYRQKLSELAQFLLDNQSISGRHSA